jgi:hypothetical protein
MRARERSLSPHALDMDGARAIPNMSGGGVDHSPAIAHSRIITLERF